MSGRILTLQRQARELGRLRTGYTDDSGAKSRPARSDTWIVTSHAEHYVQAAADEWGGTAEKWQPQGSGPAQWRVITEASALDAILPPGDPLSQTYEMWSRGGCQRRCDGVTEQISDSPCPCLAQFGDAWYEQAKGTVCSAHTRLNVILPQMPDVGVWRMETGSFYAANEIAAHVDLIRNATRGEIAVPIRLRIEPRQRVAAGQTKKFPVVVIELRGSTAGQLLAGTANLNALPASTQRPAIEGPAPGSEPDWAALVAAATTREELLGILADAKTSGMDGPRAAALEASLKARATELGFVGDKQADDGGTEESRDRLWSQIVASASFETTKELEDDFCTWAGVTPDKASAEQLRSYLDRPREKVPA
jgi:hypothetical protein